MAADFQDQCRAFLALEAAVSDRAELLRDLELFGADMEQVRAVAEALDKVRFDADRQGERLGDVAK